MDLDTRVFAFALWGVGTVMVYAYVLRKRNRAFQVHHDARSRRDLLEAGGLLLVSLAAATSVFVALFFGTEDGPIREWVGRFLSAIALGGFTGVGIVMATEPMKPDPADR